MVLWRPFPWLWQLSRGISSLILTGFRIMSTSTAGALGSTLNLYAITPGFLAVLTIHVWGIYLQNAQMNPHILPGTIANVSGAFAVLLSIPTALAYTSITLLIPVFNIGVFVLAGPRITLSTVSFTGCVFALFLVTAGRARRWGDWAEAKRKALEWAFLTEHREARGMAGLDFEDPLDDEKLDPNLADATKILFFGRTKELPKEKPSPPSFRHSKPPQHALEPVGAKSLAMGSQAKKKNYASHCDVLHRRPAAPDRVATRRFGTRGVDGRRERAVWGFSRGVGGKV